MQRGVTSNTFCDLLTQPFTCQIGSVYSTDERKTTPIVISSLGYQDGRPECLYLTYCLVGGPALVGGLGQRPLWTGPKSGTVLIVTMMMMMMMMMTVDNTAAASNQRGQQPSQPQQQLNSSGFPCSQHPTNVTNHTHLQHPQQQLPAGPSSSSASSLSNEDAVNLQNPFADSPKTFGYSRSLGNCGPSSCPVPDYGHGHRMEAYHDVCPYPRNVDGGYCVGMSSYPGRHCVEPCFNQYVILLFYYFYYIVWVSV